MPDREKVKKGLECCSFLKANTCRECPYWNVYGSAECAQMAKDALELLKEQEGTIKELQNAYGYLQKQFFKAQDKLLKKQEKKKLLVDSDGKITPLTDREQDYRTWIIDMFHKYNRDDLIALMVQKGEGSILAGLLKEQEPKKVIIDLYGKYCPWCSTKISRAMGTQKLHLGTKFCPFCGQKVKWE